MSESWDNTGLLLGDPAASVERLMTCLTLTPPSVAEAIESRAQMVVAHHPLPFKPISKLTTDSQTGRMLWYLARAGISVYSPHTAWDSAGRGINARLAELLELKDCQPIVPQRSMSQPSGIVPETMPSGTVVSHPSSNQTPSAAALLVKGETFAAPPGAVGSGRLGTLPEPASLHDLTSKLSQRVADCRPRGVNSGQLIRHVGIACGSGGSLLESALATGKCDLFLTGEGTFHTCLEAQAAGISLLMIGHFASERFAMVQMAAELQQAYPQLSVWASRQERDPVENLA
ncbi:MAG: Nif3-like dinuclear metal center hexameric protein [Planctomycetales bacterium]|nr:Nif3-like dinuclear metal center hexameric protein [Planctomycetales bacterium]